MARVPPQRVAGSTKWYKMLRTVLGWYVINGIVVIIIIIIMTRLSPKVVVWASVSITSECFQMHGYFKEIWFPALALCSTPSSPRLSWQCPLQGPIRSSPSQSGCSDTNHSNSYWTKALTPQTCAHTHHLHTQSPSLFPTFLDFCAHLQTMRASCVCWHSLLHLLSCEEAANPTLLA